MRPGEGDEKASITTCYSDGGGRKHTKPHANLVTKGSRCSFINGVMYMRRRT